ncbi:MAG: hydrogenase maturation protease [Desulfobacterales bacterium]|nr:MAG: hydrogenase maturation protease [Desulfobacterales bacterium]
MRRNLVIGYGNLYRKDDGVAFYVVNRLRRRLGQQPLDPDGSGLEELGAQTDSIFIRQLVPEMLDTARHYGQLIFVDAHTAANRQPLACIRINPAQGCSPLTHHMGPAAFLVWLKALYEHEPSGYLLTIQGQNFDFHRGLSAAAAGRVEWAVNIILRLLAHTMALEACKERRPGFMTRGSRSPGDPGVRPVPLPARGGIPLQEKQRSCDLGQ